MAFYTLVTNQALDMHQPTIYIPAATKGHYNCQKTKSTAKRLKWTYTALCTSIWTFVTEASQSDAKFSVEMYH